MPGVEVELVLVPAKQSLPNSCVSACIGTALGHLAGGDQSNQRKVAEEARDRLEAVLGDRPVTLEEAAVQARPLFPMFDFEDEETPSVEEAVAQFDEHGAVVILGVDAARLYGERGGQPRRHAVILSRRSYLPEGMDPAKAATIALFGRQQSFADPDPAHDGLQFSLAEVGPAFLQQVLIIKRNR